MATRYIPHPSRPPSISSISTSILEALRSSLPRVHRHLSSRPSVYVGVAGTLLMDWYLSRLRLELQLDESNENRDGQILQQLAASLSSRDLDGAHTSFLETNAGPATLLVLHHLRLSDPEHQYSCPDQVVARSLYTLRSALRATLDEFVDHIDDGCEVLYGRAGLLYALLLLRGELERSSSTLSSTQIAEDIGELCTDDNIDALVGNIIERGIVGATLYSRALQGAHNHSTFVIDGPPLMWTWHGKRYVGAAHGIAGILQMILSAQEHFLLPYWPMVVSTIEWLLIIQDSTGNWPSKAPLNADSRPQEDLDALVQWCHGAPGVLILLSTFLRRGSSASITNAEGSILAIPTSLRESCIAALTRGGHLVYERGLLRKGVGLCHGVAGSVFALLAVSDILDDMNMPHNETGLWLTRAAHLAHLACEFRRLTHDGEMNVPDRPYSLYEGLAGMCAAWGGILARVSCNGGYRYGMPGYDDVF